MGFNWNLSVKSAPPTASLSPRCAAVLGVFHRCHRQAAIYQFPPKRAKIQRFNAKLRWNLKLVRKINKRLCDKQLDNRSSGRVFIYSTTGNILMAFRLHSWRSTGTLCESSGTDRYCGDVQPVAESERRELVTRIILVAYHSHHAFHSAPHTIRPQYFIHGYYHTTTSATIMRFCQHCNSLVCELDYSPIDEYI